MGNREPPNTRINLRKSLPLRFVQKGYFVPQLLFWPLSSSTRFQTSDLEGELCLSISVTFLKPAIGKRERLRRPPRFPRLVFTALPTRKKRKNYSLFWRRASSGICSLIGNKDALLHKQLLSRISDEAASIGLMGVGVEGRTTNQLLPGDLH